MSSPTSSKSSNGAVRILLVDDNQLGLTARRTVLEELGYRITTATSGADALESFGRGGFDLLITDYKMPKMSGKELIERVRKQSPALPVILLSGFVDALGLNEESTGADVVIQKSANEVSHLLRAVNRLVRTSPSRKPAGLHRMPRKSRRLSG